MDKNELKSKLKQALKTYDICSKIYIEYTENKLFQFQLTKFASMLPDKGKVLDAGCGIGRDSKYLSEDGFDVIAIDISESMLEEAKKREVKALKMDMNSLKFDKDSFDGIWCMASFSDIPKSDSKKVLKQFYKVLKPKGVLYLAVKEGEGEKLIKKEKYNNNLRFYSYYTQKELTTLLTEHNFEICSEITAKDNENTWVEIFARKL